MKGLAAISNYLRRIGHDERGAVAVTFLVVSTLMLGGAFGAIDLVRHNVAQGRLQNALDAAAISAGRNLANRTAEYGITEPEAWVDDARNYFRSNMPDGYFGSSISTDALSVDYSEERSGSYLTGQFVDMSVEGELPLISTGFMKIASAPLAASNQAVRRTRNDMEVVMALDNSGSMRGTPLSTLKTAARDLTETILGASEVPGGSQYVYVGLVPFSDVVNVGNSMYTRAWLDYPPIQENHIRNYWSGCIVEPRGDWSRLNPMPASVRSPSDGFQAMHTTYSTTFSLPSGSQAQKLTANSFIEFLPSNRLDRDRRVYARRTPGSETSIEVRFAMEPVGCLRERQTHFLSQNRAAMDSAINSMEADGYTIIPAGLLWAWRMLHPNWRGAWDGSELPRDPDRGNLSKVIVLLTDGQNEPYATTSKNAMAPRNAEYRLAYDYYSCSTWFFICLSWSTTEARATTSVREINPNASSASGRPMNALKMQNPETLSTDSDIGWNPTASTMNTTAVNEYMKALCQGVKGDGNEIKIYAVTLGNVGSAVSLMQDCASGPGYYFNAQTASDLPAVFASIAGALTELRLTE